jgi:MoxR-like ATPase
LADNYVHALVEQVRNEVKKVIVGQDQVLEQVLIVLLAEGHALIEGVPGTAKTLLVAGEDPFAHPRPALRSHSVYP